jgi:hypothetical protein
MTYVVTTYRPGNKRPIEDGDRYSRREVATLEEAQARCVQIMRESPRDSDSTVFWRGVIRDLPEPGGTVGLLPDGTVIEVTGGTGAS